MDVPRSEEEAISARLELVLPSKIVRRVFLSSVGRGLEKCREATYEAIGRLDGYHCVRMEDFGARGVHSVEHCISSVATCEIFVGIVGHLYGSCPPGSSESFTE